MDRRTFVKTSAGIAGAATIGAAAYALGRGMVSPRAPNPGPTTYIGAHKLGGPAPRGVPYVPITVKNGVFAAKAGPLNHARRTMHPLDWHEFCGAAAHPGLREDYGGDDILRYHFPEDARRAITPWYADRIGEPIRPQDFAGPGFGARFAWRTVGDASLTGVIIHADAASVRRVEEPLKPGTPLDESTFAFVKREIFHESFIAASNVCTHFCCESGYKESEALARPRNAWDRLFCTCHNAIFELREPAWYSFEKGVLAA